VDLVLNSLSGEAIEKNFEALAPYGRFLEIGIRDIYENRRIGLWPFHKSLSYFSVDLSRMLLERPEELGTALRELMGAFARRELEPLPVEQADLVDASSVFRTMAQARHIGKLVLRVDPDAPVAAERVEGLRADGSYLVTGGLGGLGLAVAEWMVGQGARHLLLLGRRPPGTAAGAILARLRERGATIEVVQGDVSQEATGDAVRGALARIARPLRGVIHAAGILDDGVLLRQSPVRFETVMAPKARGAWNVHAWTREAPLDFFVLFSSAAALLGSPGQGNYCAANGFLDGLAHALRRAGRPACAVSFGPWAEVGMAADAALRGLESLSPDRGTEALGRILASAVAQATVLRLDLRQFVQVLPQAAELPLLDELRRDAALEVRAAGPSPVRAELLAIPSRAARERHLSGFVGGQVAAVLGLDPGAVDERQPLTDMGLDSLLALELRNRCEAGLGVQLSPTLLWSHPTLEALVPELARRMGVELEVDPGGESEDDDADAYEGRSAEELALALAQRLDGLAEEGTA